MLKNVILSCCFAAAVATTSFAVAADAPAQNPTLSQMHGSMWPKQDGKWAVKDQCLKCHGSFDKLAEQTKDVVPNPHYSHLGEVD